MGRRRRHPARGGTCVVVTNGIQDGDNGGDEESHKSTDAEPNKTELSCTKAPGLYLSDYVVWLLALCFLHRIIELFLFSTKLIRPDRGSEQDILFKHLKYMYLDMETGTIWRYR